MPARSLFHHHANPSGNGLIALGGGELDRVALLQGHGEDELLALEPDGEAACITHGVLCSTEHMHASPAAFVLLRHPRDHELVLLTWHPPSRLWGLPGGKAEAGEGIAACARRELREETGLDFSGALWPLASGSPIPAQDWPGREPRRCHVFEVRDGELLEERIPESAAWLGPEGTAVRWGRLEELVPFFGEAFCLELGMGRCGAPSPLGLRCVRPAVHGDSRSTGHRDARGVTWATESGRRAGNAKREV